MQVTALSGVSYASVYEQTHSRQCCNLFISWLWTQPAITVWLFCLVYKVQYTLT